MAGASGAPLERVQADIERVTVDLLPGDLTHPDLELRAQPDVHMDSSETFVFVEAKRLRRWSFQADQLAKELILAAEHGGDRHAVLLLILSAPPPIRVQGHGALSIEDAVLLGQQLISARHRRHVGVPQASDAVAWTTWADIGATVAEAAQNYNNPDESTFNAVTRLAMTVTEALRVHALKIERSSTSGRGDRYAACKTNRVYLAISCRLRVAHHNLWEPTGSTQKPGYELTSSLDPRRCCRSSRIVWLQGVGTSGHEPGRARRLAAGHRQPHRPCDHHDHCSDHHDDPSVHRIHANRRHRRRAGRSSGRRSEGAGCCESGSRSQSRCGDSRGRGSRKGRRGKRPGSGCSSRTRPMRRHEQRPKQKARAAAQAQAAGKGGGEGTGGGKRLLRQLHRSACGRCRSDLRRPARVLPQARPGRGRHRLRVTRRSEAEGDGPAPGRAAAS